MVDIIGEEIRRQKSEIRVYLDGIAQPMLERGIDLECAILRPSSAGDAIFDYARAKFVMPEFDHAKS